MDVVMPHLWHAIWKSATPSDRQCVQLACTYTNFGPTAATKITTEFDYFKHRLGIHGPIYQGNVYLTLHRALMQGQLHVCNFLRAWFLLEYTHRDKYTLFVEAARHNCVSSLQFIKDWYDCNTPKGLTLNDVRSHNNKVLREAARNGHLEVLQFLKDWREPNGSELHLTIQDVRTDDNECLRVAAANGHVAVLKFLMEWDDTSLFSKATRLTVNDLRHCKRGVIGQPPLLLAARNGHVEVLQFLKDCGLTLADARRENNHALRLAASNARIGACQFLKDWGVLNGLKMDDVASLLNPWLHLHSAARGIKLKVTSRSCTYHANGDELLIEKLSFCRMLNEWKSIWWDGCIASHYIWDAILVSSTHADLVELLPLTLKRLVRQFFLDWCQGVGR